MKDQNGVAHGLGTLAPKEFATGSLGWDFHTKLQVKVGDCTVWVQANVILTVVGSKDLPRDQEPTQPAA